jgi:NAD(P)-dependent dehydrogenase (short-subunit alcohol dehydrogenase family)
MQLAGKTAIITGAGTSVGRALAIEFARAGANAVCCGRRKEQLQATVRMIEANGGCALAVPTDVSEWSQVRRMVDAALERFGQIDLLFNNAGSFQFVGAVWEADPEVWWADVRTNLLGSMQCCRAVLPHMIERNTGILLNMDGGGGSLGPNIGGSAYGCSKAAICRFTEGLARELEREGHHVLVFCMMPGFVRSEMTDYLVATPERLKWQRHVIGMRGSPAEFPADACAKATMELLRIAGPELNGRIFYVDTDFQRIGKNKSVIQNKNLYVLHLMTLDGVLGPWPARKEKQRRPQSQRPGTSPGQ